MYSTHQIKNILHQFNLKATATRIKVLDTLIQAGVALSHNDIQLRMPEIPIDKVTLYRTLNSFEKCGLVHKVANEERNWLYAFYKNPGESREEPHGHAHFICEKCDRIYCLAIESDNKVPSLKKSSDFLIKSYEYRVHGVCPACL